MDASSAHAIIVRGAYGRWGAHRAGRLAPFRRLARRRPREPRLHHLPGRQALPDRHHPERPPVDPRPQPRPLHGPRHRPRRHALDVVALPALALRELPRARRHARTATTRSTCRSPATPPATSTSTTSAPTQDGRPIFVATRYNCLATTAERASFTPLWRPPFIDRLAAEDRCHLNGLAMKRRPARARHLHRADERRRRLARAPPRRRRRHRRRQRRDRRRRALDAALAAALPRPALAGAVRHRRVRPRRPRHRPLRADLLPAGLRPRHHLRRRPRRHRASPARARTAASRTSCSASGSPARASARICHLAVVNLATGDIEHRLVINGPVQELYDVVALPGIISPAALRSEELQYLREAGACRELGVYPLRDLGTVGSRDARLYSRYEG